MIQTAGEPKLKDRLSSPEYSSSHWQFQTIALDIWPNGDPIRVDGSNVKICAGALSPPVPEDNLNIDYTCSMSKLRWDPTRWHIHHYHFRVAK